MQAEGVGTNVLLRCLQQHVRIRSHTTTIFSTALLYIGFLAPFVCTVHGYTECLQMVVPNFREYCSTRKTFNSICGIKTAGNKTVTLQKFVHFCRYNVAIMSLRASSAAYMP